MKPWMAAVLGIGIIVVVVAGVLMLGEENPGRSTDVQAVDTANVTSNVVVDSGKRPAVRTSGRTQRPRNANSLLGFPAPAEHVHDENCNHSADTVPALTPQEQQRAAEFQRIAQGLMKNIMKELYGIDQNNLNTESMQRMAQLQADMKVEGEKITAYFKERFEDGQPDRQTGEAFGKFLVNDLFVSFDTNGDNTFTEAEERALTDHLINQLRDEGMAQFMIKTYERFEVDHDRKNLAL